MKAIRMNQTLTGPTVRFVRGEEYEVDDNLADAFCADGRAELVGAEKTTTKRPPRKRRTPAARAEKR